VLDRDLSNASREFKKLALDAERNFQFDHVGQKLSTALKFAICALITHAQEHVIRPKVARKCALRNLANGGQRTGTGEVANVLNASELWHVTNMYNGVNLSLSATILLAKNAISEALHCMRIMCCRGHSFLNTDIM
jgi:hypothetical protein